MDRQEITIIAGKPVRYRIRRSKRARHITLSVDKRDGLVVVMPQRTTLAEVSPVLAEYATWIDRQLEKHGVRYGPVRKEYVSGSELRFRGQPRRIEIRPLPAGRKRSRVDLAENGLVVALAPEDGFRVKEVLGKWLRKQAGFIIRERVWDLAKTIGLFPAKVIVGERISRWGSCSPRGTLSFCYRLVMAPPPVLDAVVAHELCHLRHLNHSPRFYRLFRLACPDYRRHAEWLRDHEDDLLL
ncbi:MAG: SprT family zinc-dependent metalloprotease [bacterium]